MKKLIMIRAASWMAFCMSLSVSAWGGTMEEWLARIAPGRVQANSFAASTSTTYGGPYVLPGQTFQVTSYSSALIASSTLSTLTWLNSWIGKNLIATDCSKSTSSSTILAAFGLGISYDGIYSGYSGGCFYAASDSTKSEQIAYGFKFKIVNAVVPVGTKVIITASTSSTPLPAAVMNVPVTVTNCATIATLFRNSGYPDYAERVVALFNSGLNVDATVNGNLAGCVLNPATGGEELVVAASVKSAATDVTSPSIPTGVTASAVGDSQINVFWAAATDDVGVTGYKVYRGGSLLATLGNVTSYSNTGLTAATAYSYSISACDAAGNCSTQSTPALATTLRPGDVAVPMVSAGNEYTLLLKPDGKVLSWGRNDEGQLGNGQGAYSTTPKKVTGVGPLAAMAAGVGFSLTLDRTGGLWAWGLNTSGELADGSTQSRYIPRRITGIQGSVSAIAAGNGHALALTADGKVWIWGSTLNGSGTLNLAPKLVAGLPSIQAIEAGALHILALARDGSVWAWGNNDYAQLGNGTKTTVATPARIATLSGITAISTGYSHNLALDTAGRIWSWGNNVYGTIGMGSLTQRQVTTPVVLSGLPQIVKVYAGNESSAAIDVDGGVWMWGAQAYGVNVYGPRYVSELSALGIVELRSGWYHLLARDSKGKVWGWGRNENGYVGDGTTAYQKTAVAVLGLSDAVALSAQMHSLALSADGTLWAWGMSGNGELGDGTPAHTNLPVETLGLNGIAAVAAGGFHSLALGSDGRVWAWGTNHNGQLGDQTTVPRLTPAVVASLSDIVAIAIGANHSLALDRSGQVWSWGLVNSGQLGRSANPWLPGLVSGLPKIKAIAAGNAHSLALGADGSVWAWGGNGSGAVGDGSRIDRLTPVQVAGLGNIAALEGGGEHSLALDAGGAVWAWGNNIFGQLGDATRTDRLRPVKITGVSVVSAIAAGEGHSAALGSDGKLWTWGSNSEGQLGRAAAPDSAATPVALADLQGIGGISAGSSHTMALRPDGTLWTSGRNFSGTLGDGTYAQRDSLILVLNPGGAAPLDLYPQVANTIPTDKIPPFLAATYKAGDLSRFSLSVDIKEFAGGSFAAALRLGMFAAGYNVYVAASAPSGAGSVFLQLDANYNWSALQWPMAEFLRGVAIDSQNAVVKAQILQNMDLSSPQLKGAAIIVGYGTDADEMMRSARYRTLFTVPAL